MSQLEPQQPVQVYPNNPNNYPNDPNNYPNQSLSSSHSNGSFGSAFVVLAIVVVISLIACVVGRLCSKKSHGDPKVKKSSKHKEGKQKHNHDQFHKREGDIEFGFDKKIASSKVAAAHGDHHNHNNKGYNNNKQFKNNNGGKGGVRFADDHHIDFKLGP